MDIGFAMQNPDGKKQVCDIFNLFWLVPPLSGGGGSKRERCILEKTNFQVDNVKRVPNNVQTFTLTCPNCLFNVPIPFHKFGLFTFAFHNVKMFFTTLKFFSE